MKSTLRFTPGGHIGCLYCELVDLRVLGRLSVVRATEVAFDPEEQRWEVRSADSSRLLFAHPSREACLRWERENLQPTSNPEPRNQETPNQETLNSEPIQTL